MPRNPQIRQGRRPAKNKRRTDPKEIIRAERLSRMMQLRLQGWTLDEIGASEKISKVSVHLAIRKAKESMVQEAAEELRYLENLRLDALQTGHWDKACAGDGWATDRVLAIMERRARLNGLDAPTKIDNQGNPSTAVQIVFNISQDDANL